MDLSNYYRFFGNRVFPGNADVFIFDEDCFAIRHLGKVSVYKSVNSQDFQEVSAVSEENHRVCVFESGYIVSVQDGAIRIDNVRTGSSFYTAYHHQKRVFFGENAVFYHDAQSGFKDAVFIGRHDKSARDLVKQYLNVGQAFELEDAKMSCDGNSVYLKVRLDNGEHISAILTGGEGTEFCVCRLLPEELRDVSFLKNGNYIAQFWSQKYHLGTALYDAKGTMLLSSQAEFAIRPLEDGNHCVYDNALIVDSYGDFTDEYRNEKAVLWNGTKIYAYTFTFADQKNKGLWPGGAIKVFRMGPYNTEFFGFWCNGKFCLCRYKKQYDLSLSQLENAVTDKVYKKRIYQALGC